MKPASLAAIFALFLFLASCSSGGASSPAAPSPTETAPGFALPPAWTDTPAPTEAPPTPTRTPTPPAGLDWATPHPADDVYDDWLHHQSKSASLWLPPGFEVADLGAFGDMMALMAYAMTEAMGEVAAAFATPAPGQPVPTVVSLEELQQTFRFDLVMAASPADEAALFLVGPPPEEGVDLGAAIKDVLEGFEGEITVESQLAISGRPVPTARLIVSALDPETGQASRYLVYVFIVDDRAWQMMYSAPADRFDAWLPLFEKSAASFIVTSG